MGESTISFASVAALGKLCSAKAAVAIRAGDGGNLMVPLVPAPIAASTAGDGDIAAIGAAGESRPADAGEVSGNASDDG